MAFAVLGNCSGLVVRTRRSGALACPGRMIGCVLLPVDWGRATRGWQSSGTCDRQGYLFLWQAFFCASIVRSLSRVPTPWVSTLFAQGAVADGPGKPVAIEPGKLDAPDRLLIKPQATAEPVPEAPAISSRYSARC